MAAVGQAVTIEALIGTDKAWAWAQTPIALGALQQLMVEAKTQATTISPLASSWLAMAPTELLVEKNGEGPVKAALHNVVHSFAPTVSALQSHLDKLGSMHATVHQ